MGLQGDLHSLKKAWSSLSPFSKVFFGLSFLLSASSIASIADTVYTIRGFLAEAISYYREITSVFVIFLPNWLKIHLNQATVDALILLTLFFLTFWRATAVSSKPVHGGLFLAYPIALVATFLIGRGSSTYYPLFVVAVFSVFVLRQQWQTGSKDVAYLTISYIATAALFVAVLAGISEGLHRPSS